MHMKRVAFKLNSATFGLIILLKNFAFIDIYLDIKKIFPAVNLTTSIEPDYTNLGWWWK